MDSDFTASGTELRRLLEPKAEDEETRERPGGFLEHMSGSVDQRCDVDGPGEHACWIRLDNTASISICPRHIHSLRVTGMAEYAGLRAFDLPVSRQS